jgi:XapX domain-containing protein
MKLLLGFLLAFAIGAVCRLARIPSPAPNAIVGALLVVSMSAGFALTDLWLARPSQMTPSLSQAQISSRQEETSFK